jgi:hypothetical protein
MQGQSPIQRQANGTLPLVQAGAVQVIANLAPDEDWIRREEIQLQRNGERFLDTKGITSSSKDGCFEPVAVKGNPQQ